MNIYEQQLTEILNPKGCGKKFTHLNGWSLCGECFSGITELCPTCQKIQQAQIETLLMCAKNELEFLKDKVFDYGFSVKIEGIDCIIFINKRISQLQDTIKKLEENKE